VSPGGRPARDRFRRQGAPRPAASLAERRRGARGARGGERSPRGRMNTGAAPADAARPERERPLTRLGPALRARLTLGRIVLAVVLIAVVFAGAALFKSDGGGAPPDHAARLVPANAVLYLHVTIDRGSGQWKNASALLPKSPLLVRLRDQLLEQVAPGGKGL